MGSIFLILFVPLITVAQDARPEFSLRLETTVSSVTSLPGDFVQGVVISPAIMNGQVYLPAGARVDGRVTGASKVGLGIRRERAALQLQFTRVEHADGRRFPITASLLSIDNAREEVNQRGRIKGILAADSLPTYVFGFWHRLSPVLPQRALMGLTGASGMTWTRIAPGPIGAAAFLGLRYALVPWPNPEIHFPVGAELRLRLDSIDKEAPAAAQNPAPVLSDAWSSRLASRAFQLTKTGGPVPGDVINLAFVGTQIQIIAAFENAGWQTADILNGRSLRGAYRAFTNGQGYAKAPVSELKYQGEVPDLVFQKSFNTIAKRHHIRIWAAEDSDDPALWLAAASHDIAVDFSANSLSFMHRIDEHLDIERAKVLDDLTYSGCLENMSFLDRPTVAAYADETKKTDTDGRLAVAFIGTCQTQPKAPLQVLDRQPRLIYRLSQRTILETRNYLLRRNAYYATFRLLRNTKLAIRLVRPLRSPISRLPIANFRSEVLPLLSLPGIGGTVPPVLRP